jgi:hypothetical protein
VHGTSGAADLVSANTGIPQRGLDCKRGDVDARPETYAGSSGIGGTVQSLIDAGRDIQAIEVGGRWAPVGRHRIFASLVLGSKADVLVERLDGWLPPIRRLGVPDVFLHDYGDQDWLMEVCGLQPNHIAETIVDTVGKLVAA